ncbi:MAG: LuxR C-terminal-related transcriptional regulator, partial [Armatimonadota bacterium]
MYKEAKDAGSEVEGCNFGGKRAASKVTLLRLYNPPKSELVPDPEALRSVKKANDSSHVRDLSPRLVEMVHLMAKRLTNTQIAAEMRIKPTTAQGFRRKLFCVLHVDNAEDAVKEARKRGLFYLPR